MSKHTILIFSQAMELGGVERSLLGLLDSIDYDRYDVDLFLMRHSGELMPYLNPKANLLPEIPQYASLAVPMASLLRSGQIGVLCGRLKGKLAAKRFDKRHPGGKPSVTALTYSHKYTLSAMPQISDKTYDLAISFLTPHYFARERVKAKKYAAWIHTDYTALSFDRSAELAMWSGYDAICGVSEQASRSFQTVFPELSDKVQTTENILPKELTAKQAERPQTDMPSDGAVKILSVGRFCDAKNFDNVPDICRRLVEDGRVSGWDDPRMPTLCGLRRRGYTPTSIFTFVREAGISKSDNLIDMRQLEACIRSELDLTAQRRIAVLDPVKLIVDNYPADKTEFFEVANNPNREANDASTRKVAFTRELWIENEDFAEVPPPKFKRLTIGGEVRLMGAYIVKCTGVEKNADGSIAAIHCTADLETGNGNPTDGRKVKGTIHWVSAAHAVDAEVRLYDKLFTEANMNAIPEGSDYKDYLNPESVVVRTGCKLEESLKDAKPGEKFQFVRTGFFTPDSKNPGVYNRVVTLRDSFKPAK